MEQARRRTVRTFLEISGSIFLLGAVNLFLFPSDPGFLHVPVNPYYAGALLAAAYYGKLFGFLTFFLSLVMISLPFGRDSRIVEHMVYIFNSQGIRIAVQLVGVYLFGMIRDMYISRVGHYRQVTKKQIFEKYKYKKEAEALTAVNRELEERVLRQNESVTSLYTQIKALHTQNLTETLNVLLETVKKFSWAEKASIWRYNRDEDRLVMTACTGWEKDDYGNTSLVTDESIEGWCFRNNKIFSVRMLLEYDNLMKMDRKRNIFTFPIAFSTSTWGILNIEDLPFSKYNLYVEKLLAILVDLASPEIERAVEYEANLKYQEINSTTGLPAFNQFRSAVEKFVDKSRGIGNPFSIVLLEVINMDAIMEKFGKGKTLSLLLSVLADLNELSGNKTDFYHFKEDSQFAIYHRDIDYDGISLFCLETLGIINSRAWKIDGTPVPLDVILGYSSYGQQNVSAEELISVSEHLLDMQKV